MDIAWIKNAEKMFEELGWYILKESDTYIMYKPFYPSLWSISYIYFYLNTKEVTLVNKENDNFLNFKKEELKLLDAIQGQTKELGW